MSATARPVGGPLLGSTTRWILAIFLVSLIAFAWRFAAGLGAVTGLNDGYPWGIWIAYDVVTSTALACGGYAVAILCYILNKGKYHPLVRSAILTSALGYSLAAVAIIVDVGRYWYIWKLPTVPNLWNRNSILLEVALCVMSYIVVLWIELSPAFLERWARSPKPGLRKFATGLLGALDRILIFIIALGLLLPTMHQSSLGGVMMLAAYKVHPIWHTGWMPLLFLLSCVAMGYAIVVFESLVSSVAFKRPLETRMLGSLGQVIIGLIAAFFAVRLLDWGMRGQFGNLLDQGWMSFFLVLETLLFLVPALMLLSPTVRSRAGSLFIAAILMVLAGSLYRFNVYLIGFDPGPGWSYFPTVPELGITFGLIALEILAYLYFVKRFPILAGRSATEIGGASPAPAGS